MTCLQNASNRYMTLLALMLLSLLVAGCGKKATPTPMPTRTPQPTWTATATPTPTPRLLKTHTVTPSRTAPSTPTATPAQTAVLPTPTPSATPFPPGPPSKLGVFVGRNDPVLFDLLSTGNVAVVKTIEYDANFVSEIKQADPDVFLVARLPQLPQADLEYWDPIAEAQHFAAQLLPIATDPKRLAAIDCWESYNEPVVGNEAQMASYARFEAERVRLLARAGVKSCIGNFSAGHPDLKLWPAFFPALEAAKAHGGYLALHEYSAPYLWFAYGPNQVDPQGNEGDEGWLTLRYRKAYRHYLQPANLAIPLVVTETGIDGGGGSQRPGPADAQGWRDFISFWQSEGRVSTTPFGFYVEQLAWYDAELAKDDYVIGAAIFVLAGPQGWPSFDIGGPELHILKQYLSVHPTH